MSTRPLHELRDEARSARTRGDLPRARAALFSAIQHTVAREEDYVGATVQLRDVLAESGEYRGALTLDWYVSDDRSQRQLVGRVPAIDRARTYLAWADRDTDRERARSTYARAADEYEQAGLVAQAAIAGERGGDFARARALWSRLSHLLSSSGSDLYAAGLARFNLARTSLRTGDKAAAREAVVAAVHLLEEAADRYETIGQRERAFDCYQVLIAVGRESREFEHVLEGYVNVIRILREDHLRYYALQSYEEAVGAAEKQGEVSAAATLAREMSTYARKEGLGAVSSFATLTQARLWQEVAAASRKRRAPPEIAENALLAAVIALGEAGQYRQVGAVYRALSELPLEESRVKHYARATGRYQTAQDLAIDAAPLPAHLRHEVGFPEVWHVDLVEWEQGGSASQACGDIVLNPTEWSEVTRRRAMLARLSALAVEGAAVTAGPLPGRSRNGGDPRPPRGPQAPLRARRRRRPGCASPSSSRWSSSTPSSPPSSTSTAAPSPRSASRWCAPSPASSTSAPSSPCARPSPTPTAPSSRSPPRPSKSSASPTPSTRSPASTASRSPPWSAPPRCARWPRSTPSRRRRCSSA